MREPYMVYGGVYMSCNIKDLESYYDSEHKNKIFCTRLCVEGKNFHILYDYSKKNEIDKFVSNFTEYLPYYVYNADSLECIDPEGNIGKKLVEISKTCWNGPTVPKRNLKANGIFGEVFLDFYERIVKKEKLASTYASRRDFKSKSENKGFDNVLFTINNNEIEFVFAESKFVVNKSNANSALVSDITGTPASNDKPEVIGHLTSDFMNDYITFVVEKGSFFSDSDKMLLKPFFRELNDVLMNKGGNFISFLIEKEITVNCVFFAIFKCTSTTPSDYIKAYDEIEATAKDYLEKMGIKKYGIEIVFIPTQSSSMEIKGAIDEYYK